MIGQSLLFFLLNDITPIDPGHQVHKGDTANHQPDPLMVIVDDLKVKKDISTVVIQAQAYWQMGFPETDVRQALFWYALFGAIENEQYAFAHDLIVAIEAFPHSLHKQRAIHLLFNQEEKRIDKLILNEEYLAAISLAKTNALQSPQVFNEKWLATMLHDINSARIQLQKNLNRRKQNYNTTCFHKTSGRILIPGERLANRNQPIHYISPKMKRQLCKPMLKMIRHR